MNIKDIEAQRNITNKIRERLDGITCELEALVLPKDMKSKAYTRILCRRIRLHKERQMLWQKLSMSW